MTSMLYYWWTTKRSGAIRIILLLVKCTTTTGFINTLLLDWLGLVSCSSVLAEVPLLAMFRKATTVQVGIERRATAKRGATASRIDARRTASD